VRTLEDRERLLAGLQARVQELEAVNATLLADIVLGKEQIRQLRRD
jgi:hypothetical protein